MEQNSSTESANPWLWLSNRSISDSGPRSLPPKGKSFLIKCQNVQNSHTSAFCTFSQNDLPFTANHRAGSSVAERFENPTKGFAECVDEFRAILDVDGRILLKEGKMLHRMLVENQWKRV